MKFYEQVRLYDIISNETDKYSPLIRIDGTGGIWHKWNTAFLLGKLDPFIVWDKNKKSLNDYLTNS